MKTFRVHTPDGHHDVTAADPAQARRMVAAAHPTARITKIKVLK